MDEDDLLEEYEPEGQPDRRACPKCGSNDVRRSSREGVWVAILAMLGRWPFRCRSCRNRFFRYASPPREN
jgi:ribosomal protein L37AE/L43A